MSDPGLWRQRRPGPGFWLLASWAAIDGAVAVYLAVYGVSATSSMLLVIGVALFFGAVATAKLQPTPILGIVLLLAGAHTALRVIVPFRAEAPPPPTELALLAGLATALVVTAILFLRRPDHPWVPPLALGLAISVGLAARAAIILLDAPPPFDVPLIQEAAADALLRGEDPYLTTVYANGYPYLPAAAVAAALGGLAGDARWAVLAGETLTAGAIILAGRRTGNAMLGVALATLWTWSSGGLYVNWQGFPEPILTGFLTLGVAMLLGPSPRAHLGGFALGIAVATKQFGVAMLPLLILKPGGWRSFAVAIAVSVACIAPFALWHPAAFVEGSFLSHLDEPGRDYSLNLLAWPWGRADLPPLVGLLVAVVAGWWVARRFADRDSAWVVGSAALLLLGFVLNRIAFVNYYAVVLVVMLLGVIAVSRRPEAPLA